MNSILHSPISFICLVLFVCTTMPKLHAQNTVSGLIIMPRANRVKIGGLNYSDAGPVSSSKKRIEMENHPNHNIVVSLHPVSFSPTVKPMDKAILTQKEKTFVPHVLPITQGSVVYILNEDEFYHNVHSKKPFGLFNIGRKEAGVGVPVTINRLGLIRVGCNEHEEMKGFILSLDTPYFTKADPSGNYQISGLPDGRYILKVFHPDMKRSTSYGEISVKGGTVTEKQINLSRP